MKTFETSARYVACLHPVAGLIVQSTCKSGGIRMAPFHPQFNDYVDAFNTALDRNEADDLCRALLN